MRIIVFDIETKNIFQEVGSNDPAALDLSVVGVYDSENNSYRAYLEEELPQLWPILERADVLVGYNSDYFDIPLLNKYYPGDLATIKSIDLLAEIKKSLGRRLKLDQIAEGTLGLNKSGHGLQALTWWKNGEIERVKKYCLYDVKLTKELYEYALAHQKLCYKDGARVVAIPIDTSRWNEPVTHSLTYTLPF